jgi:hypothetical protein
VKVRRINSPWIIVPWLTLIVVVLARQFGADNWIESALPLGLGRMAVKNSGWGLLLLTFGCSARWAYLRVSRVTTNRGELIGTVICMAILITLAYILVAFVTVVVLLIVIRGIVLRLP